MADDPRAGRARRARRCRRSSRRRPRRRRSPGACRRISVTVAGDGAGFVVGGDDGEELAHEGNGGAEASTTRRQQRATRSEVSVTAPAQASPCPQRRRVPDRSLQRRPYTAGPRVRRRDPAAPARAQARRRRPPCGRACSRPSPGAGRAARPRCRPRRRVGGRHRAAQRPRRERARGLRAGPRGEPPRAQPPRPGRARCRPKSAPSTTGSNLAPILLHPEGKPTDSRLDLVKQQLDKLPAAARKDGTGPNAAANYPPLYYAYEAVAYKLSPDRSLLGRMFFMRLATTLLLVVTVWLTWLIAVRALHAHVGAHPGHRRWSPCSRSSASARGSSTPTSCSSWSPPGALLMGLRLVRHGPTMGRVLWLAAFAAPERSSTRAGSSSRRSRSSRLSSRSCGPGRAGAGALSLSAALAGIAFAGVAIAVAWSQAHAGGAISENPVGGFSAREFAEYLWQFYLPKAQRDATEGRPSTTTATARSTSTPTSAPSPRSASATGAIVLDALAGRRRALGWPRCGRRSSRAGMWWSPAGARSSCAWSSSPG